MTTENSTPENQSKGNADATPDYATMDPIPLGTVDVKSSDGYGGIAINNPDQSQVGAKPGKEPEKEITKPDESKADPEGQPKTEEKPKEGLDDSEIVKARISEKIDSIIGDGNAKDLETSLENWDKFTKLNTDKAMELSAKEKALGDVELVNQFAEIFSTDEFAEIITAIKENPEALSEYGEFFESEEKNPLAKLAKMFDTVQDGAKKLTKAQIEQKQREKDLEFQEEVLELDKIKDSLFDYSNMDQKIETGKIADQYNVKLKTGHLIRTGIESGKTIQDLNAKVDVLQNELKKAKANVVAPSKPKNQQAPEEDYGEQRTIATNRSKALDEIDNVRSDLLRRFAF